MSILKTISNWLSGKKTVKRKIKQYRRNGKAVKGHTRTMTVSRTPYHQGFLQSPESADTAAAKGGLHSYIDYLQSEREQERDADRAFLDFYERTGNRSMANAMRTRLGKTYK